MRITTCGPLTQQDCVGSKHGVTYMCLTRKKVFSYCDAFTALAQTHKCPISGKDRAEAELISREGAGLEKGI